MNILQGFLFFVLPILLLMDTRFHFGVITNKSAVNIAQIFGGHTLLFLLALELLGYSVGMCLVL